MPTTRQNPQLSTEEATRIITQADAGTLDLEDPKIARIVGDARRTQHRSMMWGEREDREHRRRVRNVLIGGAVFVAFCVLGLVVPLAISLATY